MNNQVRASLLEVIQDRTSGRVFDYGHTGVSESTLRSGFSKACKRAGIPFGQNVEGGLIWHDLRRTFATELRGRQGHEYDISDLLGHTMPQLVINESAQKCLRGTRATDRHRWLQLLESQSLRRRPSRRHLRRWSSWSSLDVRSVQRSAGDRTERSDRPPDRQLALPEKRRLRRSRLRSETGYRAARLSCRQAPG
jgi:hypothetical protein